MEILWGIDFGARRSGNTAIAISVNQEVKFHQAEKGEDADAWIDDLMEKLPPEIIAIDAPLSLPSGWCGGIGDLFYRQCDKEMKAMSPLFLGGLTGRAVRFKRGLKATKIKVIECYPKGFVNHLLKGEYPEINEGVETILEKLPDEIHLKVNKGPENEHQLDALMALVVAFRFRAQKAESHGKYGEGLIWI